MAALGRYIVMLGYAGARTALTLAELHREEVQKRFPKHFLKQEEELHRIIQNLTDTTGNGDNKTSSGQVTYKIREMLQEQGLPEKCLVALQKNEVFPALWELAERLDAGLEVELHKIPVLQLVIEISELFDANPYVNMTALENKKCFQKIVSEIQSNAEVTEKKLSKDCDMEPANVEPVFGVLIATDEPEKLLAFADVHGLPSAVIGRLTNKNDRVVRNGEIIRYLTPEG